MKKLVYTILLMMSMISLSACSKSQDALTYESVKSSKSELSTSFKEMKSNKYTAYILYKPTCPVCVEYESEIIKTFKQVDYLHYVDSSNGIPKKLVESLSFNTFEGAKTPYLVVIDKDIKSLDDNNRFEPVISMRLSSSSSINSAINSINKLVESEYN